MPQDDEKHKEKKREDPAFRRLYQVPDMMLDFLRFAAPALAEKIKLKDLREVSPEHIGRFLQERRNDILWSAATEQHLQYFLIMVEHQSANCPMMALRMMTYRSLAWEHAERNKRLCPNGKLPRIFARVIYTGDGAWTAPTRMRDLLDDSYDPAVLAQLRDEVEDAQQYEVIEVNNLPEAQIQGNTPTKILFRMLRVKEPPAYSATIRDLSAILPVDEPGEPQTSFILLLGELAGSEMGKQISGCKTLQEVQHMFGDVMSRWEKKIFADGEARGIGIGEARGIGIGEARGEARGIRTVLQDLLHSRFNELPQDIASGLAAISDVQKLRALATQVYAVDSLAAFRLAMHKA